jgi:hypothetical protein
MTIHPANLRRGGALKVILIILGVIFAGFILVCAGCLTLGYYKGKPMMAEAIRQTMAAPLDSSRLPEAQKKRIQACIDRFMGAVKEGKSGLVEITTIAGELDAGPYDELTLLELARDRIAGLLEEEETRWKDASQVIDRLARGIAEGRIAEERVDRVLDSLTDKSDPMGPKIKQSLTEVEAEDFLEAAAKEADRAKIPDEPYKVDLAGELEKVVDKVLGGGASSAPAEAEATEAEPEATDQSAAHKSHGE